MNELTERKTYSSVQRIKKDKILKINHFNLWKIICLPGKWLCYCITGFPNTFFVISLSTYLQIFVQVLEINMRYDLFLFGLTAVSRVVQSYLSVFLSWGNNQD